MSHPPFTVATLRDCPGLESEINRLASDLWPKFMLRDPVVEDNWRLLYERYPEYQLFLLDGEDRRVIAVGNSCPLPWEGKPAELPDTGIDWILTELAARATFAPKNQFALQIMVDRAQLGHGLSGQVVAAMTAIGRARGCRNLFAPVRPNRKGDYPLIPMEHYIRWTRDDGLPFDPWMRVHARLGAEIVGVCARSMYIPGSIAQWEAWTGLTFPGSGEYVVPGGLAPVRVDRERDRAEYLEPNVWMRHRLT